MTFSSDSIPSRYSMTVIKDGNVLNFWGGPDVINLKKANVYMLITLDEVADRYQRMVEHEFRPVGVRPICFDAFCNIYKKHGYRIL